jgi:hypothetical protein
MFVTEDKIVTHSHFKRGQGNLRVNDQSFGRDINNLVFPRVVQENDSTQRMTAFLEIQTNFSISGSLRSGKHQELTVDVCLLEPRVP